MNSELFEELSQERKTLQKEGILPDWFTTGGWQLFKSKYLPEGMTPIDRYKEIASAAASFMPNPDEWEERFFNVLWKGWLSPSTPVLSNMGRAKGTPVSCSGGVIGDSIYSFYQSQVEAAVLTQNGFGTSGYLGAIRPRGSEISSGGKAAGIVPVLKDFVQLSNDVSQGSQRRGSWAGYIPIEHNDFWEVSDYLFHYPDGCNIGWIMSEKFKKRLDKGDDDAVKRYQRIMKIRSVHGKGYIQKHWTTNKQNPPMYKDRKLEVVASNLCVAPETMILTDVGYQQIASLEGDWVNVWNGDEWSNVQIVKTGVNQPLIKVVVSETVNDTVYIKEIQCTPYHKFYTKEGVEVEAAKLKPEELLHWSTMDGVKHVQSVISVTDEGRIDDTYCFTEPKRHMGVFNGILTGQCNEISLHSSEEYTFTCVLSSMNLYKYDEWKDTDAVFTALVFLDCVAEEFLQKARNIKGMEKAVAFTEKSRALGLGVMGLHSLFQKRNIPFESFEAHQLNTEIFSHIQKETTKASEWMAKELGEPDWCVGYGVRNTHKIAIAPTMSTSLICGGVSQGIEPLVMNVFNQTTAGGEVYRISPELIKRMQDKGVYNHEAIKDIERNHGSVQHVHWLNGHDKMVFKTAFEIDQSAVIRLASARQRYIDQSQSLNLFFSADESEEYISEITQMAIDDEWIKGLYYQRSMSGVKATRGECVACEG
jgi:ribonucleotide reductase alpha subunit